VLSDPGKDESFRSSPHWESSLLDFRLVRAEQGSGGQQVLRSNSFSGNERNRLVMGSGEGFVDRSLVSGMDCREDARSFAVLDFDGDGWLDVALASASGPRLRLFRNRFGELGAKGRAVEVVLRGGHAGAVAGKASNRDGVGAVLTAVSDQRTRVFRKSIGEGLGAQNAGCLRVTLAEGETLQRLSVRWPSGAVTGQDGAEVGATVVIEE
jgi:hypothetical protein